MKIDYKWRALALLWVAFFLQQGTRQIFGATLSSIQGSLGVSAAQIGIVATMFTFAYGLSVPFAGETRWEPDGDRPLWRLDYFV